MIEIVKKVIVYGEDKSSSSQGKNENEQKRQSARQGRKGDKGNRGPSGGQKGKVQVSSGDSHQEVAAETVMVVMGSASTNGGKSSKPNE